MKLHSETNTLLPENSMPRAEPEQEAQALTTIHTACSGLIGGSLV